VEMPQPDEGVLEGDVGNVISTHLKVKW
jgi:hypothetical protein